jgi:predicted phage gp36 major capsid-like protein
VPTKENFLTNLPDDKEALKAMLRSLWQERERLEKRAEEQQRKIEEQRQRADELYLEKLRLQVELERLQEGHLRSAGGSPEHEPAGADAAGIR